MMLLQHCCMHTHQHWQGTCRAGDFASAYTYRYHTYKHYLQTGSGWLTHCSTHVLQVAEEEAGDLSAPAEEEDEEELMEESMDEGEAEGGLPSLGKRRSTDTALSAQTGSKRPRPGSLAEVTPPPVGLLSRRS